MTPFGGIALVCFITCITSTPITDEKPTPNLTSYIFMGNEVSDPVPYIVSIQYRIQHREWMHFCGGSIISSRYILTAAHCLMPHFEDHGIKLFRVLAGRNNLKTKIGSRHRIVSYTIHPDYVSEFNGPDVGIIKVHPKIKFNQRTITKIEFESSKRVLADIPVVFHGWGITHFGIPDRLQGANFTTLSQETCPSEANDNLSSTDLCVISKDSSVPYRGDSGGPLVNEKQTLQIGICSYGFYDINHTLLLPTVFARVSEFSNWIKDEIKNE